MVITYWRRLANRHSKSFSRLVGLKPPAQKRPALIARLGLELLEDRTVLSTLFVDLSGRTPGGQFAYTTIQGAVGAASAGDTIQVDPGSYNENVTIPGNLIGVILDGARNGVNPVPGRSGAESVVNGSITVDAPAVTVDGFTVSEGINVWRTPFAGAPAANCIVQNNIVVTTYYDYRIWIGPPGGPGTPNVPLNCLVQNNVLSGAGDIILSNTANNTVQGNVITTPIPNTNIGIELYYANNNTVQYNSIVNSQWHAIRLRGSHDNLVQHNTGYGDGQPYIQQEEGSSRNTIQNNNFQTAQTTAITVDSSVNPSVYGQPVTFTATVTSGGGPVSTGTVTFQEGNTVLAPSVAVDNSGQATFQIAALTAAYSPHTITAYYSGTASLEASSGSAIQTVNKAPLLVTGDDETTIYGQTNPAFTALYTGFVLGEDASVLEGTLGFSTPATLSSPPGDYPITLDGLTSANYAITFESGTLTVAPAPLTANGVDFAATAGAPFSGVVASFTNADPYGDSGSYTATITWGDGNTSAGSITDAGGGNFQVSGSNSYADSKQYAVQVLIQHQLGYTTSATTYCTATVNSLGLRPQAGQTAGIGFWHNNNGQALIKSFNGGPNATGLANWLALTFPNLYGSDAGGNNLFGKTNTEVAAFYLSLFNEHGPKLDAQVLAAALNVYATTLSLGGTSAKAYGFRVSTTGLGARSFSVGVDGAAFGVPNHTVLNVYQILKAVNEYAVNGVLYNGDAVLRDEANDLVETLNQTREGG